MTDTGTGDTEQPDSSATGNTADTAAPNDTGLTPEPTGPLVHLKLDGDATDSSGNGYDGTTVYETFTLDRFGEKERAFDFGDNDITPDPGMYQRIEVMSPPLSGSFTIAAWFYGRSSDNQERIAGQGNGFELFFDTDTRVAFGAPRGVIPAPPVVDDTDLPADEWTFLVGVVEQLGDNSMVRLYRNGALVVEQLRVDTVYESPSTPCGFYVGNIGSAVAADQCIGADDAERLRGAVDDVRVYDRVLPADEIEALFSEGGYTP